MSRNADRYDLPAPGNLRAAKWRDSRYNCLRTGEHPPIRPLPTYPLSPLRASARSGSVLPFGELPAHSEQQLFAQPSLTRSFH